MEIFLFFGAVFGIGALICGTYDYFYKRAEPEIKQYMTIGAWVFVIIRCYLIANDDTDKNIRLILSGIWACIWMYKKWSYLTDPNRK